MIASKINAEHSLALSETIMFLNCDDAKTLRLSYMFVPIGSYFVIIIIRLSGFIFCFAYLRMLVWLNKNGCKFHHRGDPAHSEHRKYVSPLFHRVEWRQLHSEENKRNFHFVPNAIRTMKIMHSDNRMLSAGIYRGRARSVVCWMQTSFWLVKLLNSAFPNSGAISGDGFLLHTKSLTKTNYLFNDYHI